MRADRAADRAFEQSTPALAPLELPAIPAIPTFPLLPAFPKTEARRVPSTTAFARLAGCFGFHPLVPDAATAALLGAARGRAPALGVPLLSSLSPLAIGELDRACGRGAAGPKALSLRELIHEQLKGDTAATAVGVLERKQTELFGPASFTIHKILELRRLGKIRVVDQKNDHPITGGNSFYLYRAPKAAFARMMQAIDAAADSIHVGFFIWTGKRGEAFADKLIEKARSGVKVRVMLDEYGSILVHRPLAFMQLRDRLIAAGVEVVCNYILDPGRPGKNIRGADHRKLLVIDGLRAFTGGLNMGDPYIDGWHDLWVEASGPVVHQMHSEWLLGWMARGGALDRSSSDEEFASRYFPEPLRAGTSSAKVLQSIPGASKEIFENTLELIRGAQRTIDIENPYITNAEIHAALLEAARDRGVKIRIVVPEKNNHFFCDLVARSYFRALLEAGAEIRSYPRMSHGKLMIVDRQKISIGTANFDDLSMRKIAELNLAIDDAELAAQMTRRVIDADFRRSKPIVLDDLSPGAEQLGRGWRVFDGAL